MSDLHSLEELFDGDEEGRRFQIPDYQRGYAWETPHRKDLLSDLEEAESHNITHFTGTIVASRPSDNKTHYDIVDGQQRLTTLVLLIARIIHNMQKHEEPKDTLIKTAWERYIHRNRTDGSSSHRLILNQDTDETFDSLLTQRKPDLSGSSRKTKSIENLVDATNDFEHYLHKRETLSSLESLLYVITKRLGFLFYAPTNSAEIGLMFEVINSRGKPLSELDKVKNFLIYYANRHDIEALRERTNSAWSEILSALNEAGLTDDQDENLYLQSCWIIFHEPGSRKSGPVYEGLKGFAESFDTIEEAAENLIFFLELLKNAAQILQRLYSRNPKGAEGEWLKQISHHPNTATILPLIIALFHNEHDSSRRGELLEIIEKLNFRYYVLRLASRSDSHKGDIYSLAYEFFHGALSLDDLENALLTFIKDKAPLRRVVRNLVLEEDEGWDMYTWQGLKFFLACYEDELRKQHEQNSHLSELLSYRDRKHRNSFYHREHILPQNNNEAIGEAPSDYNCRRLANFILLPEGANQSVSNHSVGTKVGTPEEPGEYASEEVAVLHQIRELPSLYKIADEFIWNDKKWQGNYPGARRQRLNRFFDEREKRLVNFALKRWRIEAIDENEWLYEINSVEKQTGADFTVRPLE